MARFTSLALLLVPALAVAETFRLPLFVERAPGTAQTARGARLLPQVPQPGPDGSVVLLAEEASATIDPENPLESDGAPRRLALQWSCWLPAAGAYTIWVQFAAPAGRTRFAEVVNGRRFAAAHAEENNSGPAPLRWLQRPRTSFQAGLNTLSLVPEGYALPRIARVALVPGETTQLDGAGPTQAVRAVDTALLETAEITIPGLQRVLGLDGAAGAAADCSSDGGKTWQPLPPAGLPVAGVLRFRLLLTPAQPVAGPLAVRAEVADGRLARLANGPLELLLDAATGGLFLLWDAQRDLVYAGGSAARPLLAVDFKRTGEAVWTRVDPEGSARLLPKEKYALGTWDQRVESTAPAVTAPVVFRHDGRAAEIVHELDAAGCGRARVTQRVEPESPGVWRLSAAVEALDGPADVVAVTFPRLDRVRLGASGRDDAQLRMMSFGHRIVQPGRQTLRDATYCGSVVMNWTQVYDREHSLYLGVHDPRGTTTLHGSQASGPEGETVGLYTRRLDEIRPGERAVWETRLAVGPGGWQRGARLYGDWFTATHGPATYPAWLRSSDGWLDLQAENYGPDFRFSRLNDWLTTARAAGLDWVQVWGQFAYDGGPCCAAWYGLSPLYGGADGWRTAARDFRQRGGHLGGYYLYHTFDRLPLFFDTYLGRFAKAEYGNVPWDSPEFQHGIQLVEDPAGTLTPHSPSEAELATWRDKIAEHQRLRAAGERAPAVMWWQEAYIANPAWRDYLADWVADRYVKDYGVDTAYLDVLCTGDASIDYDPRRGHNGDGSWGEGRRLLAKEVYERGRAANPEFALTGEGLGDLPGLYAAQLCSGVYYGHRNIVRYTFPDRVLFHGMANAGSAGGPLERWLETFREAMRFDIVGQPSALPMALLTLLRHATPSIWTATFQDTIGLEPSDPRVAARRHDLTSGPGGSVLTVTNPAGVPANLRLDPPLAGRPAFRIDLDGTVTARPPAGSLPLSTQLASLWWLPDGQAGVWPLVRLRREAPAAVEVVLLNGTARAQTGRLQVTNQGFTEPFADRLSEARAALPFAETPQPYRVAAGSVAVVSLPLADPSALRWSLNVEVSLEGESSLRRAVLLTPLALNGDFELVDGTPGERADGQRALHLPPTDSGYLHRLVDLWLLPNRRYRLAVSARRTGFTAAVAGTLLRLNTATEGVYQDHRWGLDSKRPEQWQRLGGEFTTPADLTRAGLYLYNVRSPDNAWFDDLRVEDLGPITP